MQMKNEGLCIILFLVSVFISSVSQIMLKKSANISHENRIKEYLNPKVIIAYGMFFCSSLLTVLAYKYVSLSLGPVLEASGYIYVSALGFLVLKEKINKKKFTGMLFVLGGIIVFNL